MGSEKPFLTAQWRDLVLLNYEVPEALLIPLVPTGTQLDRHDGRLLASVVGFRFVNTRVLGWPVPFHRHFEEVNLRFYVLRRLSSGETRRGVVFVRELVPKAAIAWLARLIYNEPYRQVPINHRVIRPDPSGPPIRVEYAWTTGRQTCQLAGTLRSPPAVLERPSEAEFITEHFWGYTGQKDGGTIEYQVTHPPWTTAALDSPELSGDVGPVYGATWRPVLSGPPHSAFYATGSDVAVFSGRRFAWV